MSSILNTYKVKLNEPQLNYSRYEVHEYMDTIGKRIKQTREEQGKTQSHIAKAAGVGKSAVSQWENDQVKGLKPHHLVAVAVDLGVSTDWLVTGKGDRTRNAFLSDSEKALLYMFRSTDERGKGNILKIAEIQPSPTPSLPPPRPHH